MDLLSSLSGVFSVNSRSRGLEYFRAGRIELVRHSAAEVHLVATGSDEYDVRLRLEGQQLLLSCTCPHFADGFPCKHLWGALLALQANPELNGWTQRASCDVILDFPSLDTEDDLEDTWEPAAPPHWREGGAPGTTAGRAPAATQRDAATAEAVRKFLEYRARRGLPNLADRPLPQAGAATPHREAPDTSSAWKAPFDRIQDAMLRSHAAEPRVDLPPQAIIYVADPGASATYGSLTIDIARRDRRRGGEWGKPKPLRLQRSHIVRLPDEADRRILSSFLGASQWSGGIDAQPVPQRVHVPPDLARTLVPALCETGRLFLGRNGIPESEPLRWDEDPWTFRLEVRPDDENGGVQRYHVGGVLCRGTQRLPLRAARLVTRSLAFFPDTVAPLEHGAAWPWLVELRGNPSIAVPAAQAPRLLEKLFTLPHVPLIDLPDNLRVDERTAAPVPCLRLLHSSRWQRPHISAHLAFDYGDVQVEARESRAAIYRADQRVLVRRDLEAEREARAALRRLGFRPEWHEMGGDDTLTIDPHRVPRAIRDLIAAGWRVEADGKLYRPFRHSRLSVKSGIDWFELHGQAEFGDQVAELPQLLRALSRGERMVTLSDGSLGLLPEEWLQRFAGIAGLGEAEGDHVRFKPTQVAVLDALLAAQPETSFDAAFAHALEALRQFESVEPVDPSPGFVGELRGYQREGLGWLEFLRSFGFGGCLADDMGLGKTVMVLALLERHREDAVRPSLVVAPRSVVFNWLREAERFAPGLRVADYTGGDRGAVLDRLDAVDLLVTTYGTLRQDAALLKDVPFEYIVLDESQAIKNAGTASAKAARLMNGAHRLALSGTPIENHVGELWSLFEFLNPGLLGSASAFGRKKGKAGMERAQSDTDEDGDRERTPAVLAAQRDLSLLSRAVRPFILRRTKEQVAKDLPERQEETIWCELEGRERQLYDELRAHYQATLLGTIRQKGLGRSKLQVLEALLRLRQAACHPGLLDRTRAGGSSAKLDALLPQLAEVREEGHKAIVFSQFTSLLAIVRKHLDAEGVPYEYLDGKTRDREARVTRFQEDPACQLFLVSLKAGGLGLNLTAAEYVFLLDPWWNPAAEAQAIDRAHRIGQTRPVFAYRLIARDTVEERILDLQRQKRDLADAIITADNSVIATLTREELEALLS